MSIKGPGIKIFALIMGVIALGVGIWMTFFRSAGFKETTATIVTITEDENFADDHESDNRVAIVEYKVDGKTYQSKLDSFAPDYKVGKEVTVRYDPKDPSKIHSGLGFGIYVLVIGAVIIAVVIFTMIRAKTSVKKLKGEHGETVYLPSEKREERELYFLTDTGTPKYGHRIEDKNHRVLYEAKMTKFTVTSPFGFDFIDHEHKTTTPHLVGHTEETEWDTLLIDNHSTFTFDGEDIWKHLKRHGITVQSQLAEGKLLRPSYSIFRDGEGIAYVESTGPYAHEEDEEQHKIASKLPTQGYFRIRTSEKNLDLLFVTLLAFARSGAVDSHGGTYGMLFGTLKNKMGNNQ